MKTPQLCLVATLALGGHLGCNANKSSPPPAAVAVRMRFLPGGPPAKGSTDFKGASFTKLGPGPQKGVLWCQASAGVGDQFPVVNEQGVTLFEVRLAEGGDNQVMLEIRSTEGTKKIHLPRDQPQTVTVADIKYDLSYPSVSVAWAPGEKPTTNKAMLIVTHRL